MAVQARRVQMIIARNLIARLTRGKPSVNFSTLDMLAGTAFSCHTTLTLLLTIHSADAPEYPVIATAIPQPYRDGHRDRGSFPRSIELTGS